MDISNQPSSASPLADTIITFPEGIPGFEQLTEYRLFQNADNHDFYWLESVAEPSIQFTVTMPEVLRINYELTLHNDELALLGSSDESEFVLLVTLTKLDGSTQLHPNILGPFVIDVTTRKGLQKTLNQVESAVTIKAS